jgi:arylsulfatase A-like enzyme
VPFIARWSGRVPAGAVSNEVIAFQDMMPTFAELADETVPENIDGISVVKALLGEEQEEKHPYLYWDYGHCRKRYDQAVRLGNWKGIRYGQGGEIELYDLESDLAEGHNVAAQFPEVVIEIEEIMKSAFTPNEHYPVGELYKGSPIWTK